MDGTGWMALDGWVAEFSFDSIYQGFSHGYKSSIAWIECP